VFGAGAGERVCLSSARHSDVCLTKLALWVLTIQIGNNGQKQLNSRPPPQRLVGKTGLWQHLEMRARITIFVICCPHKY